MNKTLGIVGGGQLGRLTCVAAQKLGYKTVILDPDPSSPAAKIADDVVIGKLDCKESIEELCKKADVITYEFENIPYQIIQELETKYNIPQGYKPLMYSQNRIREKTNARNCGLNVGEFYAINSQKDLEEAINKTGYPAILKTTMFGYDGKGQLVLRTEKDLEEAKAMTSQSECILEKFINFDYEISVLIIRDTKGNSYVYPIPVNTHKHGILYKSDTLTKVSKTVEEKATKSAIDLMNKTDLIGILAVEMFVKGEEVYFNEMAPRPHNSFHYTIEGCNISQFEALARVVLDIPMEEVKLVQPTIMINVLGQDLLKTEDYVIDNPNVSCTFHSYEKDEIKHNRKMAHITFFNKDEEKLLNEVKDFEEKVML